MPVERANSNGSDACLGRQTWRDVTCIVRGDGTFEETVERDSLKEESFTSSCRTVGDTPTSYEDKIMFMAIQHAILSPSSLREVIAADVIVATGLATEGQGKQVCVGNIGFS